jgi:hypothetical protein
VVNVSVHTEGRYAFVELRTQEMATASLQLNGQVGVRRASGWWFDARGCLICVSRGRVAGPPRARWRGGRWGSRWGDLLI